MRRREGHDDGLADRLCNDVLCDDRLGYDRLCYDRLGYDRIATTGCAISWVLATIGVDAA